MHQRWLLAAVPLAIGLEWGDAPPMLVFCASLTAIIPLVGIMGTATEHLAAKLGPTIGGLLNSTLNTFPNSSLAVSPSPTDSPEWSRPRSPERSSPTCW